MNNLKCIKWNIDDCTYQLIFSAPHAELKPNQDWKHRRNRQQIWQARNQWGFEGFTLEANNN